MKRAPRTVFGALFSPLLRGVAGAPRAPGAARALSAAARPPPPLLSAFPWRTTLDTRWEDMDCYNHINNVKFYSFFDTAVNRMLLELGLLTLPPSPTTSLAGFVVASSCSFLAPLRFPLPVTVGVRVGRLGTSSVSYEVGVFSADGACAATGSFTHAYVNPATHRAQPLPGAMREALQRLCAA